MPSPGFGVRERTAIGPPQGDLPGARRLSGQEDRGTSPQGSAASTVLPHAPGPGRGRGRAAPRPGLPCRRLPPPRHAIPYLLVNSRSSILAIDARSVSLGHYGSAVTPGRNTHSARSARNACHGRNGCRARSDPGFLHPDLRVYGRTRHAFRIRPCLRTSLPALGDALLDAHAWTEPSRGPRTLLPPHDAKGDALPADPDSAARHPATRDRWKQTALTMRPDQAFRAPPRVIHRPHTSLLPSAQNPLR